ncbi:MAG: hypothetical protein KatS3mg008_1226 [Acidimicrobiales bacterium]|nr:MAG: hypothetical protein KatS3mg008_1226 [Acidimicrobiales bacterium]
MSRAPDDQMHPVVDVSTQGHVPEHAKDYAREKILRLSHVAKGIPWRAHVHLEMSGNPAVDRPALAEATIYVDGTPVRAHVAAHDHEAAVDLLEDRLRRRLSRRFEIRRGDRVGAIRSRNHQHRPQWVELPPDERQIVRHKTFALEPMTVDEAAFDLEMLDHDFYLFTEMSTGADCVIYHSEGGLVLSMPESTQGDPISGAAAELRLGPPAPTLTRAEAVERLESGNERFVFYVDSETGRGNVLYHRYDGHYGLITPE